MYDFKSLSHHDFELLVRDLLQEHLGVALESFKRGRDAGIDLRYSPAADKTLVVQCKHYAETGYNGLIRELKNEVPKVTRLAPNRYCVATSVQLTPGQKDEILALFAPYCKGTGDIFGGDELNNILAMHPNVERVHYKLWLTSTTVLDKLLHSRLYEQSRMTVEDIRQKLRLYVQNESYSDARRILSEHHYCIISGIPGIGKTFLAEVLLLHYLGQDYEPFVIRSNIAEAYDVLKADTQQVFYYDDFLGQTGLDDKLAKNEDQALLQFISYAREHTHIRFILTTREYVLQYAKQFYERLDSPEFDHAKCIVELEKYTRRHRAQILYNHLYFSALSPLHKQELCKTKAMLKVIDHPNYSPRIIQWMSDESRLRDCPSSEYAARFIEALNSPTDLWRHAYDTHISLAARCVLLVLASVRCAMRLEDLQEAFMALASTFTRRYGSVFAVDACRQAIQELEGSFIRIERTQNHAVIGYHNPSVLDFMEAHLADNAEELRDLATSAVFYDQFMGLCLVRGKEDHARIAAVLGKNPSAVRDVLLATVSRSIQRLYLHQDRRGGMYMASSSVRSTDENIDHAIRTLKHLDASVRETALERLIGTMCDRVRAGIAEMSVVPGIISAATELGTAGDYLHILIKVTAEALSKTSAECDTVDDYYLLCEFDEATDGALDAAARELVAKTLESDGEDIFDYEISSASDESELNELYERAESLAAHFGISLDPVLKRIESAAEEIRAKEPDYPDDFDGPAVPLSPDASDADIVSMFETVATQ